jgi:hypothetical protein
MSRKMISTWGMIVILLVSLVGTAAAQDEAGDEPPVTETPVTEPTYYAHPVVQILSAYFGRHGVSEEPDPEETPDPDETVDPDATPTAEPPPGPEEIAEQIAQYHEDGMGFGVLVKLYAIAEASAEECAALDDSGDDEAAADEAEECTVVTVDELVEAVQGGTGMGQLFKEYGKPALLGVGHVRKALEKLADETAEPPVDETLEPPDEEGDSELSESKPGKQKPAKGKPPKQKTPKPKNKDR